MPRTFSRPIKRLVVKVGSSNIATDAMRPRLAHLRSLVAQICAAQKRGVEVVLVSSGAIVLGMGELDQVVRPTDLAGLQALAAIGQTTLMHTYRQLFKRHEHTCAQVLLTWDDFNDRARYINARNTFQAILARKAVPIVNENDTISTDEIKFGDNDKLSALVASLIGADLLIILSDVEGLYDLSSGKKKVFQEVAEITKEIEGVATGSQKKQISKGGMTAKLSAIKIATHGSIPCVIAHGALKDVITRVIDGECIGTFFIEKKEKLLARKHWISFGARPKGVIRVDAGAKAALLKGGRSLLLPGIAAVDGNFHKDDVVAVCDMARQEIARGISNYSADELRHGDTHGGKAEAIHCDNLVLCQR